MQQHLQNYKTNLNNYLRTLKNYRVAVSFNTCKEYLKIGGILLVNNSHGDAGLASIDKDYKFIAIVHKSKGKYRISETSLEKYFIPKKNIIVTKQLLYKMQKGIGYTETAPLYLFKRIS